MDHLAYWEKRLSVLKQSVRWSNKACLVLLGTDWSWPFQCCYGNEGRFCDKQTLLAILRPICPDSVNYLFAMN